MSDLRDHLLDLLTDAQHERECSSLWPLNLDTTDTGPCDCLVSRVRAALEPTFRRPQ